MGQVKKYTRTCLAVKAFQEPFQFQCHKGSNLIMIQILCTNPWFVVFSLVILIFSEVQSIAAVTESERPHPFLCSFIALGGDLPDQFLIGKLKL